MKGHHRFPLPSIRLNQSCSPDSPRLPEEGSPFNRKGILGLFTKEIKEDFGTRHELPVESISAEDLQGKSTEVSSTFASFHVSESNESNQTDTDEDTFCQFDVEL